MEILFLPMLPFISFPPLALAPAGIFIWLHFRCKARSGRRNTMILLATAAWFLYSAYEAYMYVWSQSVLAPIRVDLLLLVPVLYAVTFFGLVASRRCSKSMET